MRIALALAAALGLMGTAAVAQEYPAVEVVEEVLDSVVSIDANQITFGVALGGATEIARQQRLLTSRMTGFVYTTDGYIITDSEDIDTAVLINVAFADGTEMEAEVIGVDEEYGIGVIKVDPEKPLKAVEMLTDIYDAKVESYPYYQGDPIVAIGNSGGQGATVTTGIIGSVRNFRNSNGILIPSMIQADTVINAGNEGCPLFNNDGKVIGFHDRQASSGRGTLQNTTFFTPMWLVKRVADEIIDNKVRNIEDPEVWRPWLGIKPFSGSQSQLGGGGVRTVGDDLKMFLDIPDQYWDVGVLVDTVWQESPAREYGLRDKDMLLDVEVLHGDNEENREAGVSETVKHEYQYIKRIEDLELMVSTAERDEIFIFGVLRSGRYFKVEVVIGQHPGSFEFFGAGDVEISNEYF